MGITPDNTIFIVLCFEGPDVYSMAGGLGARITHLTRTLADMGYGIHHFFIGDPSHQGMETTHKGKIILHRWCQWISQYYPGGVYDGEEDKLRDYISSIPSFVLKEIIKPAAKEHKNVVVLGEEWQTADTMCRLSTELWNEGLRKNVVMFWNANNTYSFERIDWGHLKRSATLTTVSKYMKQIMSKMGLNPFVISNGIEKSLLNGVSASTVKKIRNLLNKELVLCKVARWHRDKGWEPAIQAVKRLKNGGKKPILMARGSSEAYGEKLVQEAKELGLSVANITLKGDHKKHYMQAQSKRIFKPYYEALGQVEDADILNLMFPIPHNFLRALYKASDLVLANSVHEPFGLVGLEAMATGAIVFTGCSGEDYATHMKNAIVLDTFNAEEIEYYVNVLQSRPDLGKSMAAAAKRTARKWVWEEIIKELICKVEYQGRAQGMDLGPLEKTKAKSRKA